MIEYVQSSISKLLIKKVLNVFRQSLHKICENTGFHWPIFSHISTRSQIPSLYGRIRVNENPYFCIFYAVMHNIFNCLIDPFPANVRFLHPWISQKASGVIRKLHGEYFSTTKKNLKIVFLEKFSNVSIMILLTHFLTHQTWCLYKLNQKLFTEKGV